MQLKNEGLEYESPFQWGDFLGTRVSFRGNTGEIPKVPEKMLEPSFLRKNARGYINRGQVIMMPCH